MNEKNYVFDPAKIQRIQEQNPFAKISEVVYTILEEGILTSEIAPGTRLNTTKIAEQLHVSNSPVIKAIDRLKENGFVTETQKDNGRYHNSCVFDINNDSMSDLFTARMAIESLAASLCAERSMLIDMTELWRLAEEFQTIWADYANDINSDSSLLDRAKADEKFHRLLVLSTENEYLINMFDSLKGMLRYLSIRTSEFAATEAKKEQLLIMGAQHIAVCRAIETGVPELASAAMTRHLNYCRHRCLLNRNQK